MRPTGHMPAGPTRLSSRHDMKSWRTDDESSRGTDLTATRTELNNMSACGAAPFRKHGRKYSAGRLWIVLLARLPRFWLDTGVASGAWVPA
jgi:hypothetical protein